MSATEILYSNLYGCEMKCAKVDIPKEKIMHCFILAEHVSDKKYIEAQANEFYGEAEKIAESVLVENSVEEVAKKMAVILTESFGERFTVEACIEYAKKIVG